MLHRQRIARHDDVNAPRQLRRPRRVRIDELVDGIEPWPRRIDPAARPNLQLPYSGEIAYGRAHASATLMAYRDDVGVVRHPRPGSGSRFDGFQSKPGIVGRVLGECDRTTADHSPPEPRFELRGRRTIQDL